MFNPPSNIDDLAATPELKQKFLELWNDSSEEGYMGYYVTEAIATSPNYVDPRVTPPTSDAVKVPWNGFPRLLSRWYGDEQNPANKTLAEKTAEIATPMVSFVIPEDGELRVKEVEKHRLPYFATIYGEVILELARPRRYVLPDGSLGSAVHRVRRQQDEYLEWHPTYDGQGRLEKITFTAEPPDYWRALAAVAPDRVVELYYDLLGDNSIPKEEIFHPHDMAVFGIGLDNRTQWFGIGGKDTYNELNPWTTTKGIIHLTHQANTLGAEVHLAAEASLVYESDQGSEPTGEGTPPAEIRRIACGGYGGINRSSDPLIGNAVAGVVTTGDRLTLTDPIGLYIANVNLSGLTGPQNQPVGAASRVVTRGEDDPFDPRILRFEVKLPEGTPFTLGECTMDGRLLERGGQIARQTTVHLYANTYDGGGVTAAQDCGGKPCRHGERRNLFLIAGVARSCPTDSSVGWLLQTPYEGEGDAAGFQMDDATREARAAADLVTEISSAEVTLPEVISHSRAGILY